MANIYGVCPERALQHKGYGDFVQHTNLLKEGLLQLVLNEPQTLQVTIGYLQNQAANMPLAYSSLKSFQNPNSGFATNLLKKFQTVNLQSAQTLRNSFGCVQIKLGETPSLKLKADNSLIGLISVREPELVNPLIQLNSVDSTESANSLIMSKTCIAGTSPNVLMKSDASHLPSRDGTQKAQKEKGSVRSTALWDDCSFNHEENHYSTDLDDTRNPYLAYSINQQVSQPSFRGEHILTTIGGWDLRLYGTLSPAQTLHTEIIGTQNLQVVKSYSQNNPEIIGAVGSANDISSAQPFGSMPSFCSLSRQESFTHELNFPFPATASICSSNESSKRIIFRVLPERSFFFFRFFSCITAYSFFGDFGDLTGGSGFRASCLLADLERSCSIFCLAALVIVSISFPALALMVSILVRVSIADARSSHAEPPNWRRAISPRMAVTINPALLSSGLFNVSIPSITSCGMRIEICFDLSLTVFLAMSVYLMIWCDSVYIIIKSQKTLTCDSPVFNLNHTSLLWCDSQKRNPTVREHMWGSYPQCYRS